MAGKLPGYTCVENNPFWAVNTDDGTMCQQPSPQAGIVCTSRMAVKVRCSVQPAPRAVDGPFSELLVIKGSEWLKFAASLGKDATGPIKDILEGLLPALKKLGPLGRATIRQIKGKDYVIISGYPGLRKILTGTKYLPENPKVADLVIGSARLGESAVKGTALSIVLVAADDVLEAVLDDKPLLSKELAFTVLADTSKQIIASLVGYIAAVSVAAMGAPVVVTIGAGIVIGIVVSKALDSVVPTEKIVKAMDEYYENLLDEGGRFLEQLEREMLRALWPPDLYFPY